MAKLQKIVQKINVPFYIDSTMFCSSHVSDCSCGHFDLRKGLRPGSTVCSENMIDWQYLSLEDLEQIGIFPKSKSWGLLVP